ncbi:MAG TPA: hypothetical protein VFO65_03725 [Acidimicrobiales bacterium]|nr:hypothetical protein [Acidimicrobiales bacterium]
MIGDFEVPARLRLGQDRAFARYVRTEVAPFSPAYAERLRTPPFDSRADLARLPLVRLEEVTDPGELVLRPTGGGIARSPDRRLALRWRWARVRGRTAAFSRQVVEPAYKPVHWHAEGIPIGYTAEDLQRLAEIGRTALEMAGLRPDDVLVGVQPPGPNLAFWQLHLGARRGSVPAMFLGPDVAPDEVARLRPTALAGRGGDLLRLLESGRTMGFSFAGLRTLLVLGEPLAPARRERLARAGSGAGGSVAVVAAWAPPGVRALWSECRDGVDVHTWPAHELIELVDPETGEAVEPGAAGEVVWSPLGWKGTVVLRLRTGVMGYLDTSPCVFCGRTTPRLRVEPSLPPFARVLDEHPDVILWQAELRTFEGAEELIVLITPRVNGHPGRLLRQLDRQLSVTQFVVLDRRTLADRLAATGNVRIIDDRG